MLITGASVEVKASLQFHIFLFHATSGTCPTDCWSPYKFEGVDEKLDIKVKMIELTAKLVREQSPVFLCGEVIECFVSFTCTPLPEHRTSESSNDFLDNLAWATAQIHCYCSSTNQKQKSGVEQTPTHLTTNTGSTSLNHSGHGHGEVIVQTEPRILFCDLRLAPGETKSCMWTVQTGVGEPDLIRLIHHLDLYRETIPMSCAPTYRGLGIKYFYKITIATQRVGSRVQVLRLPIRVLPLPEIIKMDELVGNGNDTNDELAPTNPFLENKSGETKLEIALHHLQNITARRRPNFYVISNKWGKVGRFCLFKPAYKLGEDIVGTLDFSCRTVKCVQVSVTLQCEEIAKNQSTNGLASGDLPVKIMNFTKHHEVCLGLMQTQIILPIPLHVTPTFATELVDVRWRLHFEFVTSTNETLNSAQIDDELRWQAPVDISIETMIWNLPVTLFPTAPHQIPQLSGKYSIVIK